MRKLQFLVYACLFGSASPALACQGLYTWDFGDPGAGAIHHKEGLSYFLGRVIKTELVKVEGRKLLSLEIEVLKDYRYNDKSKIVSALAGVGCVAKPNPGYIAKFGIKVINGRTYLHPTSWSF
jgi:hypothetical protein